MSSLAELEDATAAADAAREAQRAALLARLLAERERPVPDARRAELRRAMLLIKEAVDGTS